MGPIEAGDAHAANYLAQAHCLVAEPPNRAGPLAPPNRRGAPLKSDRTPPPPIYKWALGALQVVVFSAVFLFGHLRRHFVIPHSRCPVGADQD